MSFAAKTSTADILSYVTHLWNQFLELHGETQIIALDINKAFDQVWYAALLNKLPKYGLSPQLCSLIRSFLSNRSITVVVNRYSSHRHKINAGVLQGSVLDPNLFVLPINDLLALTDNPIHSFADYSTLHSNLYSTKPLNNFKLSSKRAAINNSLSQDLTKIMKWGGNNIVQFIASKSQSCSP